MGSTRLRSAELTPDGEPMWRPPAPVSRMSLADACAPAAPFARIGADHLREAGSSGLRVVVALIGTGVIEVEAEPAAVGWHSRIWY